MVGYMGHCSFSNSKGLFDEKRRGIVFWMLSESKSSHLGEFNIMLRLHFFDVLSDISWHLKQTSRTDSSS